MITLHALVGHGWRLPVYAETQSGGLIEVTLAPIPMLKIQRQAAVECLSEFAEHEKDGRWYLTKHSFDQCTLDIKKQDPEAVVVWNSNAIEIPKDADDFVDAYTRSRHAIPQHLFQNADTFRIIWNSICNFMLEWMLHKDRPVPLGFANINAFPLRANWKNVVISRVSSLKSNRKIVMQEFAEKEIMRIFSKDHMTAYDEGRQMIKWSLDITPTYNFHRHAETREIKRKAQQRTIPRYETKVLRALLNKNLKIRLYEALMAYVRETIYPYLTVHRGGERGGKSHGDQPQGTILPPPKWQATPVVIGSTKKDGRTVASEDATVLTVQDLLILSEDLRIAGNDMDPARSDEAAAARLLMLLTKKESRRRELLAGGTKRTDDGLAEGTQHGEPDNSPANPTEEPGSPPPDGAGENPPPDQSPV